MNTKDKLELLRELAIDKYIEGMQNDEIHFRDMASVISLLSSNSVTIEKSQSSLEEEIKTRVKEAEKRRLDRDT